MLFGTLGFMEKITAFSSPCDFVGGEILSFFQYYAAKKILENRKEISLLLKCQGAKYRPYTFESWFTQKDTCSTS